MWPAFKKVMHFGLFFYLGLVLQSGSCRRRQARFRPMCTKTFPASEKCRGYFGPSLIFCKSVVDYEALGSNIYRIVFHLHLFKFMLQLVNHLELLGTLYNKVSTDACRSERIFDNCFGEDLSSTKMQDIDQTRVSVQGVESLGGHFATLCRGV